MQKHENQNTQVGLSLQINWDGKLNYGQKQFLLDMESGQEELIKWLRGLMLSLLSSPLSLYLVVAG